MFLGLPSIGRAGSPHPEDTYHPPIPTRHRGVIPGRSDHYFHKNIQPIFCCKQLLDEVDHYIKNYPDRSQFYLSKPKAEADNIDGDNIDRMTYDDRHDEAILGYPSDFGIDHHTVYTSRENFGTPIP